MITVEQVKEKLKECSDPELNIDVVKLGLIYNIKIENNIVKIEMTFTSPMCPYAPYLLEDIKTKVKSLKNVKDVLIDVTFDPPWQPSEELKAILGI